MKDWEDIVAEHKSSVAVDPSVWDGILAKYAKAQPARQGSSGEVRGLRNNNPGNIEGRYFGATGNDGRFAQYASPEAGISAIDQQLNRYYNGQTTGKPLQTIKAMINTWAPPGENNTGAYVQNVARSAGVDPNAQLNFADPGLRARIIAGIIQQENGRNPYTMQQIHAAISPGAKVAAPGTITTAALMPQGKA